MDINNIEQYIKELSLKDKKTLAEKIAKLFEEGGELAKVALPYSGVYTTNHRVVDRMKVLEECVDAELVVKSIRFSLNFTKEEYQSMLVKKAMKWENIQKKEDAALEKSDTMIYEIHLTVEVDEDFDIPSYRQNCESLQVKPIVLDLQNQEGKNVMKDVMTSSKFYGNNGEAFNEMKRISNGLKAMGYNVIREKIEAAYWHTKAPFKQFGDTRMPENCYFESHMGVLCNDEKLPILSKIAKETNSHLSKNAFKHNEDGTFIIMLTYRSYSQMYEDFRESLDNILDKLSRELFTVEKEDVEFSIYDTKINHDSLWLEG